MKPSCFIAHITYTRYSELEREANIARNRALLQELELKEAVSSLGIPKSTSAKAKSNAKPVQPAKKVKRERNEDAGPRRTSARLRTAPAIDPNESPGTKRKREVSDHQLVLMKIPWSNVMDRPKKRNDAQ